MALSKEYKDYLSSPEWLDIRNRVLHRDNFECQTCCWQKGLEVHHKHYRNLKNESLNDLITLCSACHEAVTRSIRNRRPRIRKRPKKL